MTPAARCERLAVRRQHLLQWVEVLSNAPRRLEGRATRAANYARSACALSRVALLTDPDIHDLDLTV